MHLRVLNMGTQPGTVLGKDPVRCGVQSIHLDSTLMSSATRFGNFSLTSLISTSSAVAFTQELIRKSLCSVEDPSEHRSLINTNTYKQRLTSVEAHGSRIFLFMISKSEPKMRTVRPRLCIVFSSRISWKISCIMSICVTLSHAETLQCKAASRLAISDGSSMRRMLPRKGSTFENTSAIDIVGDIITSKPPGT